MALVVKNPLASAGDSVGKIPSSRKWQPTSVFLPGKSHTQRSLASYSPWGCQASDMTEQLSRQACNVYYIFRERENLQKKIIKTKTKNERKKKKKERAEEGPLEAASSYLLLTPAFQLWLQACANHLAKGKPCPSQDPLSQESHVGSPIADGV